MIDTDGMLCIMATDSTDIVAEMQNIHHTSKVCSAALGRLLTAATMMGSMLKGKNDSLTVKINGKGPCGSVLAVSDSNGGVKGYIGKADVNLPLNQKGKLDVAGAVGQDGFLSVIKDLHMKEPYVGQTPIVSGEIAEDITAYYAASEQTPTVCALGVLVNPEDESVLCAGGFMIQLLPTAAETTITRVENCIRNIKPVTSMLAEGISPEKICRTVLAGFQLEKLDETETVYHCGCSRERMERALISTGKEALLEMAQDDTTEVICNFCNTKYHFSKAEILQLL